VEHVETWAFEAEAAALERVDRVGLELTARSLAAKRTQRTVRRSWLGRFLRRWRWPR